MTDIKTFLNPVETAEAFANDFAQLVQFQLAHQAQITVALSGGSTPQLLFRIWAEDYADQLDWERIHFFWGDERCVPPTDPESNFGIAKKLLFDRISIPELNLHRIIGEADIDAERIRYENEIKTNVAMNADAIPQFDLIILGIGDDGHTASIFPEQIRFMSSPRICEVAVHPVSGQRRITLTGPVLNHAKKICFLVTGENKARVLKQVANQTGEASTFPAAQIAPENLVFYLDKAAASRL